jgi:large subunit ribosomal protein L19
MNPIVQEFEKSQVTRKSVPFKIGDMVRVQIRIKEGEKERLQAYEGLVTAMKGTLAQMRFTVRKISYGVGVEKSFLYQSPLLKEVKLIRSGKVRRAKLFYLRAKLSKKDTRIQEHKKTVKAEDLVPETGAAPTPEDLTPQLAPEEKPEEKAPKGKSEKVSEAKPEKAADPKA